MKEKIWIECTCDYEGWADMIKPDGWKYYHPMCPGCGAMIEDVVELSKEEFNKKIVKELK